MKSSSISYRVADFPKQHPPFSYVAEEDLIALGPLSERFVEE